MSLISGSSARRKALLAAALVVLSAMTGCRMVLLGGTENPAAMARGMGQAFKAMELRYTNVTRDPRFDHARMRLARYALAPSKLVRDTSIWTSMLSTPEGAKRLLEVRGESLASGYRFSTLLNAPAPTVIGAQRHRMTLIEQGNSEWLWQTSVEHDLGELSPSAVVTLLHGVFRSTERPASLIRADYQGNFSRSTAALGRLMRLDSIFTVTDADGATLATIFSRFDSRGLEASSPHSARYVRKYVETARFHARVSDRGAAEWFRIDLEKGRLELRYRSQGGYLVPLSGAVRALPDSLLITIDAAAKFGAFSVGASKLKGTFVIQSARGNGRAVSRASGANSVWNAGNAPENGFSLQFVEEPDWHFPPLAQQLIRSPLRHLFGGNGIRFNLGVRTGSNGHTLLVRDLEMPVKESATMRFLGNLGFTAMSDFAGTVEAEENRFLAGLFVALQEDLAQLAIR